MLGNCGHWAVRFFLACHTYWDTGHPIIPVISEDPWHSHLTPSVWQWSSHYLLLRFMYMAVGIPIWNSNLPIIRIYWQAQQNSIFGTSWRKFIVYHGRHIIVYKYSTLGGFWRMRDVWETITTHKLSSKVETGLLEHVIKFKNFIIKEKNINKCHGQQNDSLLCFFFIMVLPDIAKNWFKVKTTLTVVLNLTFP